MGAGIFVVTGEAAYKYAGPAVVLSFALAGACSSVYAICFAELAAMVSKAGSAYTYSKEAFGNGVGFVVGWCLLAEYIFCVSAVAVGWSGYLTSMLKSWGLALPTAIDQAPFSFDEQTQQIVMAEASYVNLPASLLVLAAGPASLAVAHSRCSTRCLCRLQPKPRCVPVLGGACVRTDLPRVPRD